MAKMKNLKSGISFDIIISIWSFVRNEF